MKEFIIICAIFLIVFLTYRIYKQKKEIEKQSSKIKYLQESNKGSTESYEAKVKQLNEDSAKLKSDNALLEEKLEQARSFYIAQRNEISSLRNAYLQLTQINNEYEKTLGEIEQLKIKSQKLNEQLNIQHQEQIDQFDIMQKNLEEVLYEYITELVTKKCAGYKHLAGVMADLQTVLYDQCSAYLKSKKNPALVEAKRIDELKKTTKDIIEEKEFLKYKLEYIRAMYPNIDDIFDDAFESPSEFELETEETTDRVRLYIEPEEYNKLSITERNQLALDKYIQGNKTDWQIGRDYELYIGQLCEKLNYKVEYTGIAQRLEDMGRDLIVIDQSSTDTYIIQCKNWSQRSEIHEKHIFQLYGSTVLYRIDHPYFNVKAVFVTTTNLSPKAQEFADVLDIEVIHAKMNEFSRIKCNINKDGEYIYHLPFDQQYDKVQIVNEGERYATTVAEAEAAGFRRAYRWNGTHE